MSKRKKRQSQNQVLQDHNNHQDSIKDTSEYIHQEPKLKHKLTIRDRVFTEKQKEFIKLATDKNTKMIFVSGPAGTGKTFLSVYVSLLLMNDKKIDDIIFVRSVVESADSKMGFLPGEADEKMAPYVQPLYDKLDELLNKHDIARLEHENRIHGIPVGFLRGLNWDVKSIIADECISGNHYIQTNTGKIQLKSLYNKFIKKTELPLVNTYNEENNVFEYKKIINVIDKGIRNIISVVLGNRVIKCTPDHKFLTEIGWVEAKDLNPFTPVIANNEVKLQTLDVMNDDQLQVFIGSYLGDGSIHKVGNNRYRLRVIHGEKQKDYCDWKSKIFNSKLEYIKENGYSKKPAFRFSTKCFSVPFDIPVDNKLTCPQWLIDKLDARGIAIWYMDDGNINISKNRIRLYTCSFNYETQQLFVKKFKSLGIDCIINEDKGNDYLYYYLSFNADNSRKLLKLLQPYIHESMNYKSNGLYDNGYTFSNSFKKYRHIIPDMVIDNNENERVYDIEVEDNHNFIITSGTRGIKKNSFSGIVVHNCQNMTVKEIITLMTRVGKFSKIFILGDPQQSDINSKSGFMKLYEVFNDEESKQYGIYTFEFGEDHIVRSELVKYIVKKIKKVIK